MRCFCQLQLSQPLIVGCVKRTSFALPQKLEGPPFGPTPTPICNHPELSTAVATFNVVNCDDDEDQMLLLQLGRTYDLIAPLCFPLNFTVNEDHS